MSKNWIKINLQIIWKMVIKINSLKGVKEVSMIKIIKTFKIITFKIITIKIKITFKNKINLIMIIKITNILKIIIKISNKRIIFNRTT
jgi:hypothetical protein